MLNAILKSLITIESFAILTKAVSKRIFFFLVLNIKTKYEDIADRDSFCNYDDGINQIFYLNDQLIVITNYDICLGEI